MIEHEESDPDAHEDVARRQKSHPCSRRQGRSDFHSGQIVSLSERVMVYIIYVRSLIKNDENVCVTPVDIHVSYRLAPRGVGDLCPSF